MRSIREIFIRGHGPSSSHTMGPAFACEYILNKYPHIQEVTVILYGSLSSTGKGHLTDYIIDLKFKNVYHNIIFDNKKKTKHPNTMLFIIKDKQGQTFEETILSVGGGTIVVDNNDVNQEDIYPHQYLRDILKYCRLHDLSLVEYVKKFEDKEIVSYIEDIYDTMMEARQRGIEAKGYLPGELHVHRKARDMFKAMRKKKDGEKDIESNVAITSFAVAEENASGGIVAIAPTCGSAGVIPGAITYLKMQSYSRKEIVDGLLVAGLIGIIAKTNGSVSGAEAGCQAEIGVACSMAASMIGVVHGLDNEGVAQCAEIALEHSLGLTCDPVNGYVQIPCIERCAMFALKAINAATMAELIPPSKAKVYFDDTVKAMLATGKDLKRGYRETAGAGLAKIVKKN